jgi:hypothetical protein
VLTIMAAVFAVVAFGVGFVLIGAGGDGPPTPANGLPGAASVEPVAPVAPHPDTVAGSWGEAVTVTGSNQSGSESATVGVTLAQPQVTAEPELDSGPVPTPAKDVYVVIDGIIEGVEGTYQYNFLHFQLIPGSELGEWDGSRGPHEPELVAGVEPNLTSTRISEGTRIRGYLAFDVPESALDNAVLVLRSLLEPEGPAAAYWPLEAP